MSGLGERKETFDGWYRGTVVDNADPLKYGRVRVRVYPMFADFEASTIPWAVPHPGLVSGAGVGYGAFSVPEVGANVFVWFEAGSIYQPVYGGEATDAKKGLPEELLVNYPNRRGFKTKAGFLVYFDDEGSEVKILHPNGSYLSIDDTQMVTLFHTNGSYLKMTDEGDVQIHSTRDIVATAGRDVSVVALQDVNVLAGRNIGMTAMGSMTVTALNSLGGDPVPSVIKVQGDLEMEVEGTVTQTVQGDVDQTISGSCNSTVTGAMNIQCAQLNVNT